MLNSNKPYGTGAGSSYSQVNQYSPGTQGPVGSSARRTRGCGPLGCLAVLVVFMLAVGGNFFLAHLPDYTPPAFLETLPFWPLVVGVVGGMLVLGLLQRVLRSTPLGGLVGGVMGFVIVMVIVGAIGWVFLINPYVGMTKTGFLRSSVSITDGDMLHFQNPRDGVTQTLCIGVDQKCQSQDDAPDALRHGIRVQPGQTVDISFSNNGRYHITSENTPGMNMTVDVSDNSGD